MCEGQGKEGRRRGREGAAHVDTVPFAGASQGCAQAIVSSKAQQQ
jgi:hypothetical protein